MVAVGGPVPLRVGLYDVSATIGRGKFAIVKLATHRVAKIKVAIKIIDKKKLSPANLKNVYREIEVLKRLSHPNIIQLYQVMETDSMIYIVTDYAAGGDLFDFIDRSGRVSETDARVMFGQIVSAVEHSHRQGIAHRDIKMENLLLDREGNIKVADWGFSNYFSHDLSLNTWCGSLPYAAPEVYIGANYSGSGVDVWSMGVVLYVLVCGALPFQASSVGQLRNLIVTGSVQYPDCISDGCRSLIQSMLAIDPKQRISVSDIIGDPWMTRVSPPATSDLEILTPLSDRPEPLTFRVTVTLEHVISVMERMGVDVRLTRRSLEKEAYDHHMGLFLLLKERLLLSSPADCTHLCPSDMSRKATNQEQTVASHTAA